MMKLQNIKWLYVLSGLLVSMNLMAQELPVLPSDPSVARGVLPNGTAYFIAENPTVRGAADFALVQRTGTEVSDSCGDPVASARDILAGKTMIRSKGPQSFFVRHGVVSGEKGFVEILPNATVFRFEEMFISGSPEVMDSTLLVLMEMIDRVTATDDPFIRKWYSPADQAIVVAGDVKASEVAQKLRYLSYMTPAVPSVPRNKHEWKGNDEAVFVCGEGPSDGMALVSATWRSPRTPEEYMHTVQPVVYEMYITELGIMAKSRIEDALRQRDVPYAEVRFRHVGSAETLEDEIFMVSVSLSSDDAEKAVEIMAETMAALDSGDALYSELQEAQAAYIRKETSSGRDDLSNSEYVDRCVAAFLQNAAITSDKDRLSFYLSRDLSPETELRLFNGIASALLDRRENLTLECLSDRMSENCQEKVMNIFNESWERGTMTDTEEYMIVDTIPRPQPVEKIKIKSTRKDHVSGGQMWTFANGFKVVHKHIPSERRVAYSLSLNGGYGSIRDLAKGEGAFMSDYIGLCRIGGLPGRTFMSVLEKEGIVMDVKVNMSNTIISGEVPKDKIELLICALIAIYGSREHDADAFDYYLRSEKLRLESVEWNEKAIIDSLMCPDYIYSPYKSSGVLSEAFAGKADSFFRAQSEKLNDGVLVFAGDYDEVQLKKLLLSYAGHFRTTERAFARTAIRYQPVSGWSTYTEKGQEEGIDIVMTALMPMTSENYMAAAVAAMAMKKHLAGVLSGGGIHMKFAYDCRIYPQERFNVMISLKEAPVDGFASGTCHRNPTEALDDIRDVLSCMGSTDLPDAELDAYKEYVKTMLETRMKSPEYWVRAVSKRYLDGKDFTTSYKEKIDAVTADKVRELLTSLSNGSGIEYIITK